MKAWCAPGVPPRGGGLAVQCSGDMGTTFGRLRYACLVTNNYTERVEGIWYVLGGFASTDRLSSVKPDAVRRMDATLEPAETKELVFETEMGRLYLSMPPGTGAKSCLGVVAAPVKLGNNAAIAISAVVSQFVPPAFPAASVRPAPTHQTPAVQ